MAALVPGADGVAAAAWHWDESHWAARAPLAKLNAEGGLEASEAPPGKSPAETLEDPYIDSFIAAQCAHHGLRPLTIITRTDNNNAVVYAYEDGAVAKFWFDVDPAYVAAARKKKRLRDRNEFNVLDRMGYGLKTVERGGEHFATMTAMPAALRQEFKLVFVGGSPRWVGTIDGTECWMEKLYVKTRKRSFNPIPKVEFVRIWGTVVADGTRKVREVAN